MDVKQRGILRDNHTTIIADLEPRDVLPQLYQDGILTGTFYFFTFNSSNTLVYSKIHNTAVHCYSLVQKLTESVCVLRFLLSVF